MAWALGAVPPSPAAICSILRTEWATAFDFPREVEINRREIADQIVQQSPEIVGTIKPTTNIAAAQ